MLLDRVRPPSWRAGPKRLQNRLSVAHEFAVTQGESSLRALRELEEFFGVGMLVPNRRSDDHREHLYRYVVRRRTDLLGRIIPFFTEHPLRTAKHENFEKFAHCVSLISEGRHR